MNVMYGVRLNVSCPFSCIYTDSFLLCLVDFSVLYYLNYKLNTKSVLRIKSVVIGLRILNLTFFFPSSLLVAILCSSAPE